jgi:hypothetical protein
VHAKGGGAKKLPIRMRNPCNRQLISIHVRFQFLGSNVKGFLAKNRAPMFEEPLRQFRDVFGMLNQVADSNSAHTSSVLGLFGFVGARRANRPHSGYEPAQHHCDAAPIKSYPLVRAADELGMAFSCEWRRRHSREKCVIARPKGGDGEYPERENQNGGREQPNAT